MSKYLKEKIDPERRKKLLEERQDRMIADIRKRESTPINQLDRADGPDVRRIHTGTDKIDTKQIQRTMDAGDWQSKLAKLLKSPGGKKVLGVLPFAGTAVGLATGDPAFAAEQAAGDIPLVGQAYEAISPDASGDESESDMMVAESKAFSNYLKSPASRDRNARLDQTLAGEAQEAAAPAPELEEDDLIDEAGSEKLNQFKRLQGLFNR